mmetsp:Transcript_55709/g.118502  ORF Transcript_55709/g.118502 Transcript_55709/m.118502 type:complete len:204 (+) Transcript_55709:75-686(+)
MMKLVAALALVGSAAAFAPAQQGRTNTAVSGKFDGELGAQAPLGFFDPLGLLADESQEQFDRLRETEIKHGRVAMLAVAGYLTTAAGIRFPGCEDIPDGFAAFPALYAQGVDGQNVLAQMAAFFAVAEIVNREASWAGVEAEFPGDYRNGAIDYGWDKLSDEDKMKKRAIELNNGRAAQMGILGLMVHEQLGVSILPENVSGL